MHETTGIQREPVRTRVEDVVPPEMLADPLVDRAHLEEVFAAPEKFLPEPVPEPEPERPAARPESPPPEVESRFARRSKLFGLLGAAALLTGSIAAAAMLRDRPPEHSGIGTAPPVESAITGAAALGGFAIPAPRAPAPTEPTLPATSANSSTSQSGSTTTGDTSTAPVVPSTVSPAAGTSTSTPLGKRELVEQFYRQVDVDPSGALSMLTGALAGDQPGDLVRAWTAMDSVHVETVREQQDGSVLAVVTMFDDDGRQLRITQQLWFAAGGLISEARLLAAQHTS
ncbi:hypothetical protein [Amycolatopsis albispora]|uniref:Uncharacterized protein n=1 Tax=Amycolatopsis albispora TaxID=1804986 RepID=A0A344LFU3_9PSEU|nr:hypothetical protein [Amycolatopsis albispora]AXB46917.1 hypothetical protein A4R43_34420 [Amycolatopsis albispora]